MKFFRKTDAKLEVLTEGLTQLTERLTAQYHEYNRRLQTHDHPHEHPLPPHDHDFMHEHPMLPVAHNPRRRVEGVVSCPQCSKVYDRQQDLHMEVGSHVRLRCECGADLSVTVEGAVVK